MFLTKLMIISFFSRRVIRIPCLSFELLGPRSHCDYHYAEETVLQSGSSENHKIEIPRGTCSESALKVLDPA